MKHYSYFVLLLCAVVLMACKRQAVPEEPKGPIALDVVNANCYIVSSPGNFSFRPLKGNSSESVGDVSTAEVIWESFGTDVRPEIGDIIKSVSLDNGRVVFSTPSELNNGNAVIATKDCEGNILWSWHIWVCKDYIPNSSAQIYFHNAGVMMDRNIGATSTTPGDVTSLGLFYEWGRKDPFLGPDGLSSDACASSTILWPAGVTSNETYGKFAYATSHPTTFIGRNGQNNDWTYTGGTGMVATKWQAQKTIYDPCPPGWRVPDGGKDGVWSMTLESSSGYEGEFYDQTSKGVNFSGKFGSQKTIWYPALGYLSPDLGIPMAASIEGLVWSCTTTANMAYALRFTSGGYVNPCASFSPAQGIPVRCIQE